MHSQSETLRILGCSKATLSNYVKRGRLTRNKSGKNTFYDEREVALLLPEIEANRKKHCPDLPKKKPPPEPGPPPKENRPPLSFDHTAELLDEYGLEVLADTTKKVKDLGIFEEIDRYALEQFAFHSQEAHKYWVKSSQEDGVSVGAMGGKTVHPYHRIMKDHQKSMQYYMDRFGLTPDARRKLGVEKKKKPSSIMDVINASKNRNKDS